MLSESLCNTKYVWLEQMNNVHVLMDNCSMPTEEQLPRLEMPEADRRAV